MSLRSAGWAEWFQRWRVGPWSSVAPEIQFQLCLRRNRAAASEPSCFRCSLHLGDDDAERRQPISTAKTVLGFEDLSRGR